MPNKLEWLALSLLKNMGGGTFRKLRERYPNSVDIFKADPEELTALSYRSSVPFEYLHEKEHKQYAEREFELADKAGVRVITWDDEEYPETLRTIYDAPVLLFAKGALSLKDIFSVAVVGSRKCSFYGQKMAREISNDLGAAGVVVTSGLALGIDSAAHAGALAGGGQTVAVLGSGLGRLYPEQNKKLADAIVENGALISEYPMRMAPLKENFPMRNRIISGLSRAVLVIEAREKSGALITADVALEEGRDIFVLPGAADSAGFRGSHALIKEGAKFVTCASDILQELGIEAPPSSSADEKKRGPVASGPENRIVTFLNSTPVHVDDIITESGINAKEAGTVLSLLEIKGLVKRLPGNHFVRIS